MLTKYNWKMLEKHLKLPSERKYSGVYTDTDIAVLMNYGRSGINKYHHRLITHEPMFLNAIRLLIQYTSPACILEFGTLDGGLANYMSDVSKNLSEEIKIISFDIDTHGSSLNEAIDSVEIVQLDTFDIKQYALVNHELLTALPHPLVIIDDVGKNTIELFETMDPYLNKGDYLISCNTLNKDAHDELMEWAEGKYLVDTTFCDMFGENFIENPNGFLIKE